MKNYFIQLKKGQTATLREAVGKHLRIPGDRAAQLILQGSVWDWKNKSRIKKTELIINDQMLLKVFLPSRPITPFQINSENLVFEDNRLLAVYKPGGVPVSPVPEGDEHSLQFAVSRYLKSENNPYFPEILHRLDTPTGGPVLFAKNKKTEKQLHALFRERKIRKFYLAAIPEMELTQKRFFFCDALEFKGKKQEAATYAVHLKNREGFSFFLIFLKTGRHHQIRKHFQKYLAPIAGDKKYGSRAKGPLRLLCVEYRFSHPESGERIKIRAVPDGFFQGVL
jgi:23S rRNA-/tRNA-specific pseudouridylate synthase